MSKNGLTEQEIPDKCETKELTIVNSEPTHNFLQVWNKEIWGNVVEILSIGGQGKGVIWDYLSYTLYAKIWLAPYQKPTYSGDNTAYPTGKTQEACKIIKDSQECDRFELITRENFQHVINKQTTVEVLPELLNDKRTERKESRTFRSMNLWNTSWSGM